MLAGDILLSMIINSAYAWIYELYATCVFSALWRRGRDFAYLCRSSVSLVFAKDTLKPDVQAARRASHRKWLGQFLLGFSPHFRSCKIYYRLVARIKNYMQKYKAEKSQRKFHILWLAKQSIILIPISASARPPCGLILGSPQLLIGFCMIQELFGFYQEELMSTTTLGNITHWILLMLCLFVYSLQKRIHSKRAIAHICFPKVVFRSMSVLVSVPAMSECWFDKEQLCGAALGDYSWFQLSWCL